MMIKIVNKILHIIGLELTDSRNKNNIGKIEPEFEMMYEKFKKYTMISKANMYASYKAVEYILSKNIQGDFLECGVWRGGAMMLVAQMLKNKNITDRKIYLYDTFEGMSEPTQDDFKIANGELAYSNWNKKKRNNHTDWCYASIEEVKSNFEINLISLDNIVFVKGKVEETIPKIVPRKLALLRLDTDWYESTKHELNHLYPLLEKDGVLIVDDYGSWAGSQKATNEYFINNPILLNRIDHTARMAIKI